MKKSVLLWCFAALLCSSCGKRIVKTDMIGIVPKPLNEQLLDGTFDLNRGTEIRLLSEDSMLTHSATPFVDAVRASLGKSLKTVPATVKRPHAINVWIEDSLPAEGYRLTIQPEAIDIIGGSPAGVFYAFQSLRQLLPLDALQGQRARTIELPAIEIVDQPHFAYRGAMLDVCRHFFTVDEVKAYIDLLAMHKINQFHWHLTDDQGWRIEIKKYPELTRIGSVREKDLLSHVYFDPERKYDEHPYGGYYTQDQIRDIVQYAADRFITVIPEIEMPGHATAALAAYPYLGCIGKDYKVATLYGIQPDAFCAGKDSTFIFLEDVLTEVMELFPSEYIHIGGDECLKDRWKECPHCQQRMRDEHLKNETQLQSYFVHRIDKFLSSKGRRVLGWDEILEGGDLSKNAAVMSWRGTAGGIEAAKHGNHVVMSPYTYCYLDYYQTPDTVGEPMAFGNVLTIDSVYKLDPYAGLNANEQQYILGVQANLWTEYIWGLDHLEYMTLPRLAAIAEVGWSYGAKDYPDFSRRMHVLARLYDAAGYKYGKHMFGLSAIADNKKMVESFMSKRADTVTTAPIATDPERVSGMDTATAQ